MKKVYIEYVFRKAIKGLDLFPHLREVHFFLSEVTFDPTEKWLSQIEILRLDKTRVTGLKDFSAFPNLRVLEMSFSGFDTFLAHPEHMPCLTQLILGANMKPVDLSRIEVTAMPCLKRLYAHTWHNTLTGIPQGLEGRKWDELIISHQQLTKEEKALLKRVQKKAA